MSALLPPALLLLWSGLAATLFVSFLIAPLMGSSTAALAMAPRRPTLPQALIAGVLLYPLLYGALFALLREASILTGAMLGIAHALLFAFRSARDGGRTLLAGNRDRLILCILYGALLGFTYVTP